MVFEQLESVIKEGIARNLHRCVQVCVSVDSRTHLNAGFGMATADSPATDQTMMLWRSAGKPLTAAGLLRLAEQGVLSVNDLLSRHLPAASGTAWDQATLEQLMSHSCGLPAQQTRWPDGGGPTRRRRC